MQQKDFIGSRLRQLSADLSLVDRLAESAQTDLKRRVREDLDRALREVGQLSADSLVKLGDQQDAPLLASSRCNAQLLFISAFTFWSLA